MGVGKYTVNSISPANILFAFFLEHYLQIFTTQEQSLGGMLVNMPLAIFILIMHGWENTDFPVGVSMGTLLKWHDAIQFQF